MSIIHIICKYINTNIYIYIYVDRSTDRSILKTLKGPEISFPND